MNPTKSIFYIKGLLLISVLGFTINAIPQISKAQIVDPLREYTNPEEIVTFNNSTTYNEALQIINTFAQDYENKFIVDNSGYEGEIGVNLPPMHWKDALQYIIRFQNLELQEYDDFYEINVPTTTTNGNVAAEGPGGGTGLDALAPTTQTQEIRINATFFEGNRRALREIGVDWSTLTNNVPENIAEFIGQSGGNTVPQTGTGFDQQFVSVNSFNAASVSQNAFSSLVNFGEFGPGISVQALFSAFEADNLGKILATPSIKVVDGEQGNIQVGQDFSIKQRDIAGNVTDNFQSTGTILNVTPTIIKQGDTSFVYLNLEVERSTVQPDVVSTIINKQEAQTSAILLDGEATYVAGLYRTEEANVRRGVPILKDLPGWFFGLRYIFGFNSKDYQENELIIIVQAELIEPVSKRLNNRRLTQREVLQNTRDGMRTSLDRVFKVEDVTDSLAKYSEDTLVDSSAITQVKPDTIYVPKSDTVYIEKPVEITPEQEKIVEELSMPVDQPELMTVVPKAFNLDQYLEYQETNRENIAGNLKYFIIGGSFLVPKNAQNFKNRLESEGYDTQILFNPVSRFNYVAYEAYSDLDAAVQRTIEIRNSFNEEAWMFTLTNGNSPNARKIEDATRD